MEYFFRMNDKETLQGFELDQLWEDLDDQVDITIRQMPKSQKFIDGNMLSEASVSLGVAIDEANYSRNAYRLKKQQAADYYLRKIRFLLRRGKRNKTISFKRFEETMRVVDLFGRKLGAWINSNPRKGDG